MFPDKLDLSSDLHHIYIFSYIYKYIIYTYVYIIYVYLRKYWRYFELVGSHFIEKKKNVIRCLFSYYKKKYIIYKYDIQYPQLIFFQTHKE